MSHANALFLESRKDISILRSICLVLLSSVFIGLFAKVSILLPFSPVPFGIQGYVILILSSFLGSKKAFAAVCGFLLQGALGLPVFAAGGGIAVLLGPTGGYLFGYLVGAFLVGYLTERMKVRTATHLFFALASGNMMFFLFGLPYLAIFIGLKKATLLGCLPFIVGDFFKLVASVKILLSFATPSVFLGLQDSHCQA